MFSPELLEIIARIGLELHPDRITAITSKMEKLDSIEQFSFIRSSFGPSADKELVGILEKTWSNNRSVSPRDLSFALLGASAATQYLDNRGSAEIIWTGPSTGLVPIRRTEQALCELISTTTKKLFLVSFIAYEVESILTSLRDAISREVQIDLLLELSEEHGGRVTHNSIGAMQKLLPSINYYVWDPDKRLKPDQFPGVVHAKCAVGDEKLAFITSANLTSAAMDRNMELGVLLRGGELPLRLQRHWEALVYTKHLKRVN